MSTGAVNVILIRNIRYIIFWLIGRILIRETIRDKLHAIGVYAHTVHIENHWKQDAVQSEHISEEVDTDGVS